MNQSKTITLARLLFVWMVLQSPFVGASIPEPDNVLYGTLTLDGELLTASDTNMAVILAYDELEIARYTLGDDMALDDRYLVKVTLDALSETAFVAGDVVQVQFKLADEIYAVTDMTVAGRGTTKELNIVMTRAELIASRESALADSDGDGIPDQVEFANGLNPFDPSDAALDSDADTISNLEEFTTGTDILRDEQVPQIIAADLSIINASGLFTQATATGAVAYDDKDGLLATTTNDSGFYSPGKYEVLWTATDAAGNAASAAQTLIVNPLANFYADQQVAEGASVAVNVELNGMAADYPVTIPYTVSGSAKGNGVDYTLADGELVISSGVQGSIEFSIIDDGLTDESIESVVITMGTPTNAVAGQHKEFVASIMQSNIAPQVDLAIGQAEAQSSITLKDQGLITVMAMVEDLNMSDEHSFDWSLSDETLLDTDGDVADSTFTIDPEAMPAGLYTVAVNVTDSAGNIVYRERLIQILQEAPVLTELDSDGDGVNDSVDGYLDVDYDGIPQYLDAVDQPYALPVKTAVSDRYLIETRAGIQLSLGKVAREIGANSAVLDVNDIAALYPVLDISAVSFSSGVTNVRASGLSLADTSMRIVLPQLAAIPNTPIFTTLTLSDLAWKRFTEDAANTLYSAVGAQGYCPAPQDSAYELGLVPGSWCVMLTIEDGGQNDGDGSVNGMIDHLGGVQDLGLITDSDEDGFADQLDAFPNDPLEWLDSDSDGVGNNADLDDDNDDIVDGTDDHSLIAIGSLTDTDTDGAPNECDAHCVSLGMSADPDDDNDGIADVNDDFPLVAAVDVIAPVFADALSIELAATGAVTDITDAINIVAFDAIDGEVNAQLVGNGLFASGIYQIEVSASDIAGNQATSAVELKIHPLTQLGIDGIGEPGATVYIQLSLMGKPASYPVSVDYRLVGGESETASFSIDSGSVMNIPVMVPNNKIDGDIIRLSLNNAVNAVLGEKLHANIYVQKSNSAPIVTIMMEQGGKKIAMVDATAGDVTFSAMVKDVNQQDEYIVEWAETDLGIFTGQSITLDARQFSAGAHSMVVTATETNSDTLLSTQNRVSFVVASQLTALDTSDTDGDGINDIDEGYGDSDGDGIPDFKDNNNNGAQLPFGQEIMLAQTGISLSVGSVAQLLSQGLPDGAGIDAALLADMVGAGLGSDAQFTAINEVVNFKASGLAAAGGSMSVVLPLSGGITLPDNAVYRKFFTTNGWFTFVADADNHIASTKRINGTCPIPGSLVYVRGLNAGDDCISLTIVDGGIYDADGQANGSIEDPGVFAVVNQLPVVSLSAPGSANEGAEITLTASGSDSDGQALTYAFEQVSEGNAASISDDGNGIATVILPQETQTSDIVFRVTATDSSGGTANAETSVSVINVVEITPDTGSKSGGSLFSLLLVNILILYWKMFGFTPMLSRSKCKKRT